jgi:subtilisin family serine protease
LIVRPRALVGAAALAAGALLAVPADATTTRASYIVTTAPGSPAQSLVTALGGKVGFVYTDALHGFSVNLPVPALSALRLLPGVLAVEPDRVVHADSTQTNPPSYGLDRIDQRNLPLNRSFTYTGDGAGVTAYVIDTGINYSHVDFGGRAKPGFDAVTAGGGAVDCYGHGTHVAGTIGGNAYGVAKKVSLVGVRVLDCSGSGSTSQVVAGIDYAARNHAAGVPAVANMSLGGGGDTAIDTAVKNAITDGIVFSVSAGNSGSFLTDLLGSSNACNSSPARVPAALTVGATDSSDARASYSSIGSCLDVFAPGTDITSDWIGSNTATNTISGTSMAAPHVTGTAAVYLSRFPGAAVSTVTANIVNSATSGVVKSPGSGSPNRHLYEAW